MADHYWPMLFASDSIAATRRAWEEACSQLRVHCSHVGAAAKSRETSSKYSVVYLGRSYVLDMQIKGSSSFDPRSCLRIYFAQARDLQALLVGHLPGHLPNRQSN